jgi:hypothetical protein
MQTAQASPGSNPSSISACWRIRAFSSELAIGVLLPLEYHREPFTEAIKRFLGQLPQIHINNPSTSSRTAELTCVPHGLTPHPHGTGYFRSDCPKQNPSPPPFSSPPWSAKPGFPSHVVISLSQARNDEFGLRPAPGSTRMVETECTIRAPVRHATHETRRLVSQGGLLMKLLINFDAVLLPWL